MSGTSSHISDTYVNQYQMVEELLRTVLNSTGKSPGDKERRCLAITRCFSELFSHVERCKAQEDCSAIPPHVKLVSDWLFAAETETSRGNLQRLYHSQFPLLPKDISVPMTEMQGVDNDNAVGRVQALLPPPVTSRVDQAGEDEQTELPLTVHSGKGRADPGRAATVARDVPLSTSSARKKPLLPTNTEVPHASMNPPPLAQAINQYPCGTSQHPFPHSSDRRAWKNPEPPIISDQGCPARKTRSTRRIPTSDEESSDIEAPPMRQQSPMSSPVAPSVAKAPLPNPSGSLPPSSTSAVVLDQVATPAHHAASHSGPSSSARSRQASEAVNSTLEEDIDMQDAHQAHYDEQELDAAISTAEPIHESDDALTGIYLLFRMQQASINELCARSRQHERQLTDLLQVGLPSQHLEGFKSGIHQAGVISSHARQIGTDHARFGAEMHRMFGERSEYIWLAYAYVHALGVKSFSDTLPHRNRSVDLLSWIVTEFLHRVSTAGLQDVIIASIRTQPSIVTMNFSSILSDGIPLSDVDDSSNDLTRSELVAGLRQTILFKQTHQFYGRWEEAMIGRDHEKWGIEGTIPENFTVDPEDDEDDDGANPLGNEPIPTPDEIVS
ncbi:hypothetical protein BXZ70DRAFT_911659 [Cristinia sonorae]|uniref:Uncharacterized protein n=1 Tax=Cristinia sonorae TaxID=1940300 RepID=A0A8K0UCB8_9AGAR|nr:hypothetical protein BXZ70DRAFT_911659 [Cristinia sonorae]